VTANTRKLRAIAEAKVKTDKVDASTLCELPSEQLKLIWRRLDLPTSRSPESSLIATSQKSRCTSNAMKRM
jgi:hypothetical protein